MILKHIDYLKRRINTIKNEFLNWTKDEVIKYLNGTNVKSKCCKNVTKKEKQELINCYKELVMCNELLETKDYDKYVDITYEKILNVID